MPEAYEKQNGSPDEPARPVKQSQWDKRKKKCLRDSPMDSAE